MSEKEVQIIRLTGTPLKNILGLAVCLVFVAIFIWMVSDGILFGYFGILLFGLGALLFAALLAMPNAAYLKLSDEGFTIKALFRVTHVRWLDVDHFFVHEMNAGLVKNKFVAFNFVPWYKNPKLTKLRANKNTPYEGTLPPVQGKQAEELVALFNAYLDAAKSKDLGLRNKG